MDVIKTEDFIFSLGPEGGHKDEQAISCATTEEIAKCKRSFTGQFLRAVL